MSHPTSSRVLNLTLILLTLAFLACGGKTQEIMQKAGDQLESVTEKLGSEARPTPAAQPPPRTPKQGVVAKKDDTTNHTPMPEGALILTEGEEDAIYSSFFPQGLAGSKTPRPGIGDRYPEVVSLVISKPIPKMSLSDRDQVAPPSSQGSESADPRFIEGELYYNDLRFKGDFDSHYTYGPLPPPPTSDGLGLPKECYTLGCIPSIVDYRNYLSANDVLVELFEVNPGITLPGCSEYERWDYVFIRDIGSPTRDDVRSDGVIIPTLFLWAGYSFDLSKLQKYGSHASPSYCWALPSREGIIGNQFVIRFSLSNCLEGEDYYETGPSFDPKKGLCASMVRRTEDGDEVFHLYHPQATPDNPLVVGPLQTQQDLYMADALFGGNGSDESTREWAIAANHYASLVETVNKFHNAGIDLNKTSDDEWGAFRAVMCSADYASSGPSSPGCSRGYAKSENEIWITEPAIWTTGVVVPHEFGHVVQRRAFNGTYGWPRNITSSDCPEDPIECPYGRRDPDKMPEGPYADPRYYGNTPPGWRRWSYDTYEWPKVAFKEGWANFVANVGLNTCDQLDRNGPSSYSHYSHDHDRPFQLISPDVDPIGKTLTKGFGYAGNITNFLCDWYDSDGKEKEKSYIDQNYPSVSHTVLGLSHGTMVVDGSTNDNDPKRPGYGDHFNAGLSSMWHNLRQTWKTASPQRRKGIQICDYVDYYLNDRKSPSRVGQADHDKYEDRIVNMLYNNGLECGYDEPASEFRNPDILELTDVCFIDCARKEEPVYSIKEEPVYSIFVSGKEGWQATGDAKTEQPSFRHLGGNPGGYISIDDAVTNGVWYWLAPQKYLGGKSHFFGRYLRFDLKQTDTSNQFATGDVWLLGAGGTRLVYFDQDNYDDSYPRTSWTSYLIKLDRTANWKIEPESGFANETQAFLTQWSRARLADDTDIKAVLGSLDGLYIRGEFRTGPDSGSLDTVFFGCTLETCP